MPPAYRFLDRWVVRAPIDRVATGAKPDVRSDSTLLHTDRFDPWESVLDRPVALSA
jgi:hypothetical protein